MKSYTTEINNNFNTKTQVEIKSVPTKHYSRTCSALKRRANARLNACLDSPINNNSKVHKFDKPKKCGIRNALRLVLIIGRCMLLQIDDMNME